MTAHRSHRKLSGVCDCVHSVLQIIFHNARQLFNLSPLKVCPKVRPKYQTVIKCLGMNLFSKHLKVFAIRIVHEDVLPL